MRSFGGKRSGEKRTMAAQKSEAGTKVLGKRTGLEYTRKMTDTRERPEKAAQMAEYRARKKAAKLSLNTMASKVRSYSNVLQIDTKPEEETDNADDLMKALERLAFEGDMEKMEETD